MTTENRINKILEAFNFFKIEVTADLKIEDKIYKNVKQFNNDSIITSKNWEQNKNTFFDQRMQTYKETFTLAEKINLEIENLEALTTNENEYRILKNRYKLFLSNEQITPQQIKAGKPKKTLFEFICNIENKEAFILELKNMFPTEQGKSIKAIVFKLVEVKILIYGTKEFLQFYNELKTYFNRDIGTYQSINDVKIVDKETTDTIYKKLNPLIDKYKTI